MSAQIKLAIGTGRDAAGRRTISRLAPVGLAALLGVVLIWGVGFAPIQAVHNAAHDTRHSNAFPCH